MKTYLGSESFFIRKHKTGIFDHNMSGKEYWWGIHLSEKYFISILIEIQEMCDKMKLEEKEIMNKYILVTVFVLKVL